MPPVPPNPVPAADPDEVFKAATRAWVRAKMDSTPKNKKAKGLPGWLSILIGPLTAILQAVITEILQGLVSKDGAPPA